MTMNKRRTTHKALAMAVLVAAVAAVAAAAAAAAAAVAVAAMPSMMERHCTGTNSTQGQH
jgi:hypothetical protein